MGSREPEDKTYILRKPIICEQFDDGGWEVNIERDATTSIGMDNELFTKQFVEFDVDATRKQIEKIMFDAMMSGNSVAAFGSSLEGAESIGEYFDREVKKHTDQVLGLITGAEK